VTTLQEPPRLPAPAADRGSGTYDHLTPVLAEFVALSVDDPRRRVLRDELIEGYLPVVAHIARRYYGRGEPIDDLEQVGTIGLLHALNRFEPDRGLNFLSYAIPTITGEMRRHFRDRTWSVHVPRALKDLQGPVRDTVARLSDELGRAPRPSEIADRLGTTREQVIQALHAQDAYHPTSLDTPIGAGSGTLGETFGDLDSTLDRIENRHALRPLLDRLPAREREILVLRFFGELTQTQIAQRMGLSQMHVSRLLTQTLNRLRRELAVRD
jgi:RNA polymerase sigma-B factor